MNTKVNDAEYGVKMLPLHTRPHNHDSPFEPTYLMGRVEADTVTPPYGGWGGIAWVVREKNNSPDVIHITADIYGNVSHRDSLIMSVYFSLNITSGAIGQNHTFIPYATGKFYRPELWYIMCHSAWKYVNRLIAYFHDVNNRNYELVKARKAPVVCTPQIMPVQLQTQRAASKSYRKKQTDKTTRATPKPRKFDPNILRPRYISSGHRGKSPTANMAATGECTYQRAGHWRRLKGGRMTWVRPCVVHNHKYKK